MRSFSGSRCLPWVHRRTAPCSQKTILWQMLAVLVVAGAVVSVVPADGDNGHPQPRVLSSTEAWSDLDGRSFLFVKENLTWIKAEKNCQSMKANLASVHSEKEYRFIQDLIISTTGKSLLSWIGGSDCHQVVGGLVTGVSRWSCSHNGCWNLSVRRTTCGSGATGASSRSPCGARGSRTTYTAFSRVSR